MMKNMLNNPNNPLKNSFFRIISMLQLFIATGICIYCSAQENIQLPDAQNIDKIFHFFAYFIYGLSLQVFFIALFSKKVVNRRRIIILTIIIGFIFAISDEIHQYFVPNRSADVFDVLIDWMGISLSLLFFGLIKRIYFFIIGKME